MIVDAGSQEFRQNPYPLYKTIRADHPIVPIKGTPTFVKVPQLFAGRYADVMVLLKDARFTVDSRNVGGRDLSKAWWMPGVFRAFMNSMAMVDEPNHTRLKTLVHMAFTPRRIQALEDRIESIANELLDQAATQDEVDLMSAFALPIPLNVISIMLGVPEAWKYEFYDLIQSLIGPISGNKVVAYSGRLINAVRLNRLFKRLIALRRDDPQDDILSGMIQASTEGDQLSEDELLATLFLLLFAGYETTVYLIGNGTLALLENPDQFEKLKANPDLLESAIEEMLRYTSPIQLIKPHYALEDLDINGTFVEKGSAVLAGIASANRDETIFDHPDQFDIARKPNKHIAFGFGLHYCLGGPLARMEAKVAFSTLLERFPHMTLAAPASTLAWRGAPAMRGPQHLPLCLNR